MKEVVLKQLLLGNLEPLGPRSTLSGINKTATAETIRLHKTGFEQDQQGDLEHHGGLTKAIHHYPYEHYALWKNELTLHPLLKRPGAFGENFSTEGITETEVAVGDTFQIGSCIIQVSQGRQPCWKLNARFNQADMEKRVLESGRTGWYYRVIQPGTLTTGDTLTCVDRPSAEWTIHRVWKALFTASSPEELQLLSKLEHLTSGWKHRAAKRLSEKPRAQQSN
jgi:MOSC domain-containing protein YiiM